jgi:hypothetical protein
VEATCEKKGYRGNRKSTEGIEREKLRLVVGSMKLSCRGKRGGGSGRVHGHKTDNARREVVTPV